MTNILLVIHVLATLAIVVLVLLQQGKGADMGAAFGGGSGTLFGARGSANFLSRATAVLATIFFLTSMSLAYIYGTSSQPQSVTEQVIQQEQPDSDESGDLPLAPEAGIATESQKDDIPEVPGDEDQSQQ